MTGRVFRRRAENTRGQRYGESIKSFEGNDYEEEQKAALGVQGGGPETCCQGIDPRHLGRVACRVHKVIL